MSGAACGGGRVRVAYGSGTTHPCQTYRDETNVASLLALRRDARILKIPPYLCALLIAIGIAWLLVLPLNEYSRKTYVSENALLPGQVHTYFGGSEHNVFRAYRQEVWALNEKSVEERSARLASIFASNNLKVSTQTYAYEVSNRTLSGTNVYAILQGPRADATEALVLIGAWTNMADETNTSGVALVLTLARYFKRWSLWSKDIIFLLSGDSTVGPQAWVDAYHDAHNPAFVQSLALKSGALQGAVAVDYPAGPWGHRYDKLHISYDGTNGQLPNLDLFNTAVQIASGQMGIGIAIQRMFAHGDSYTERLTTLLRGMVSQALGHATGPHSAFIPYHVDAITMSTVGDGWHDEMSLGKTVESLFRSLNNLLEHLHQSFFFYLLVQANRFVSIGTYLPSAMLIAAAFSVSAIGLWIGSGRPEEEEKAGKPGATVPSSTKPPASSSSAPSSSPAASSESKDEPPPPPQLTPITLANTTALVPTSLTTTSERHLLPPLLLLLSIHALSLAPLYAFNTFPHTSLPRLHTFLANTTTLLPVLCAWLFAELRPLSAQETQLLQCFSLLGLGMYLAALATLNFSQAFAVGALCTPLAFVRRTPESRVGTALQYVLLVGLNPLMVAQWGAMLMQVPLADVLEHAAVAWGVQGAWTAVTVWCVWFPAWMVAGLVVSSGMVEGGIL
ncbi:Glycosyl phosphatidyl inositol protein transamidase complex subunit [Curvularia kusanoi]|uniref:Glycosyl phosphatidyl inositol protein transamidase complex subunit n=1 Tax=Curvularia kusanoi TaxID=90978 RepID=A0A9P4W8F3_CURKU|nr:Glycosyl phosphatidyl inositol protein transamidase complex subunit [Curvularia kusanoi]